MYHTIHLKVYMGLKTKIFYFAVNYLSFWIYKPQNLTFLRCWLLWWLIYLKPWRQIVYSHIWKVIHSNRLGQRGVKKSFYKTAIVPDKSSLYILDQLKMIILWYVSYISQLSKKTEFLQNVSPNLDDWYFYLSFTWVVEYEYTPIYTINLNSYSISKIYFDVWCVKCELVQ